MKRLRDLICWAIHTQLSNAFTSCKSRNQSNNWAKVTVAFLFRSMCLPSTETSVPPAVFCSSFARRYPFPLSPTALSVFNPVDLVGCPGQAWKFTPLPPFATRSETFLYIWLLPPDCDAHIPDILPVVQTSSLLFFHNWVLGLTQCSFYQFIQLFPLTTESLPVLVNPLMINLNFKGLCFFYKPVFLVTVGWYPSGSSPLSPIVSSALLQSLHLRFHHSVSLSSRSNQWREDESSFDKKRNSH